MKFRKHPHLYEINTLPWLRHLSAQAGKSLSLGSVPESFWWDLRGKNFDFVWLMGVWKRSPGAGEMALESSAQQGDYDRALPGWKHSDITGSPYAVHAYRPDRQIGTSEELAALRRSLNEKGMGLILDFVSNHLALDHPWTISHPDYFVRGTEHDLLHHSETFFRTEKGVVLASGKDPYFPAWRDTVQVNYFSHDFRKAWIRQLQAIAKTADGVRCDMAMLGLNRVFQENWAPFLRDPVPETEFWAEAIQAVKKKHPHFLFIAEVYWDREEELQGLGFDFTCDKKFYDRLLTGSAAELKKHLAVDYGYQFRSARFLENHDERRAVEAFGAERGEAAAVAAYTLPGMRFFYDGQLEGRRVRLPVQMRNFPLESMDPETVSFYHKLLGLLRDPLLHDGFWELLEPGPAGSEDQTCRNLLAWIWRSKRGGKRLVVVNHSSLPAKGRIVLADEWGGRTVVMLTDHFSGESYERHVREIQEPGLYVELGPWKYHVLVYDHDTGTSDADGYGGGEDHGE